MLPVSDCLRSALLWAMIPLTLFASRPATGCTCASGEYKLFCVAHLPHRLGAHDSSGNGVPCQKACCQQHRSATYSADCCQTGHCPLCDGNGKSGSNSCCNPDKVTAVTAASPLTFSVDHNYHLLFDSPAVEVGSVVADLAAAHFVPYDTGPPGGDLVIWLRRLLV
ncbi:MAG: hypothetical protein WD894_15600 [Pirellulales bacterium]